ncbi:glycogen/starch/alpha-glucan phosphorylase [Lentisphaerota bacterium WC36G]|nr:glycogen/starch/alpha-glucan phosphorylase [Lentisphaerae bacterium WC36]
MKEKFKRIFKHHLVCSIAKRPENATTYDKYNALALTVRDLLVEKWIATDEVYSKSRKKEVFYLSLEYLMGRVLGNALLNLDIMDIADEALKELGCKIVNIREEEVDEGLGNGGLGRLAACFLDSLATLEIPAIGYGIRYDYGIFKQVIEDGYQVEQPDNWLKWGNPWEVCRTSCCKNIKFYGHTESRDPSKPYKKVWIETVDVRAVPYDTPIPGYKTNNINTLRLWSAQSVDGFNLNLFNQGDYINANLESALSENITKVLYPNDNNYQGKELRLKQQYFLVSATLQDIIESQLERGHDLNKLDTYAAIQLNDTHPALAIPELMRILIDDYDFEWSRAWEICEKTFSYTNHTLMSEALEKWSVPLLEHLLPRVLEIIYDINYFFMRKLANHCPGDNEILSRMSLIEEGTPKMVRMAYMAVYGSHKVNGVAELHTELLKNGLFNDFYRFSPERFVNVTNGITPRRWLLKSNPLLAELISEKIDKNWPKNLEMISKLTEYAKDKKFMQRFRDIKQQNKENLANYIMENNDIKVDPNSIFDVQIKRLHEYKRQLLNILHVIALYIDLKDDPNAPFVPRTIIFGAKAAPGYHLAKLIIKFINSVAEVINNDIEIQDKLKIVFLDNYRVSLAEKIIPAADVSEQISLAGTEASGTGNMKLALNGALTIGTLDGANIEIKDAVGEENIYIFGLNVNEVDELRARGYNPWEFINKNYHLKRIMDLLDKNFFNVAEPELFKPIIDTLHNDYYMLAADFEDYYSKQQQLAQDFLDKDKWAKMSLENVAKIGYFSSDRSIKDYASKIWNAKPLTVKG